MAVRKDFVEELGGGIAFFMPAFNEAENLPVVVGGAVAHLATLGCPYTVIIVNDGSNRDDTHGVSEALARQHSQVDVKHHGVNMGYGAALRTGIKASLATAHDWIAFCDSDGQFDPASIDLLLEAAIGNQTDFAVGFRKRRADSVTRKLMGRGWHAVSQVVGGFKATDVDCGFKLFRRSMLEIVGPMLIGDYATISPEIFMRAKRLHFIFSEVGLDHSPRLFGEQTGAKLRVVVGSIHGIAKLRFTIIRY